MFNLKGNGKSAYQDARSVREAMNLAINRDQIVKVVYGGAAQSGSWFAPKGIVGHKDAPAYPYDPQRAKARLSEAGFANGLDVDPLSYPSAPEEMYNGVIADWAKVGIRSTNRKLTTDYVSINCRPARRGSCHPSAQNVTYDGAADLVRWFRSIGSYSIMDNRLDQPIDQASAAGGDQPAAALQGVFQQIFDGYLIIPLVETQGVYAFRKDRIKDWPQILSWNFPRGYGQIIRA